MKKIQIIFLILTAIMLSGCDNKQGLEESFLFEDSVVQDRFIAQLQKTGIPFRIDEDGYVWYPYDRKEDIGKIIGKIRSDNYSPGMIFFTLTDQKYANLFESKLFEKSIEYNKDRRDKEIFFKWDENKNSEVQELIVEINLQMKEEKLQEFIKNHDEEQQKGEFREYN